MLFNFNLLKVIIFVLFKLQVTCPVNGELATEIDDRRTEIALLIENGNYSLADEEIFKFNPNLRLIIIHSIVHFMYDENRNNFEKLTSYAANSQHPIITYKILEHLWRGLIVDPDPRTFTQFCELYKSIIVNIIIPENFNLDYIEYANIMLTNLKRKIEKYAIPVLTSSLERNVYDDAQEISNLVYHANETIFDEIICKVIDDVYDGIRFRQLVLAMWHHEYTGQKAAALSCIFVRLKRNLIGNPFPTMTIAHYFYKLKKLPDYLNLSGYMLARIKNNINDLPSSVVNLFFASFVSIRNGHSKDLIAADIVKDEYKHGVFLKSGGHRRATASWYVIPIDDNLFKFRNVEYPDQYLYTGEETRGFWTTERLVYTWQAKENLTGEMNDRLIWSVFLKKNGVVIKNEVFYENLCLSEETTLYDRESEYRNAVLMRSLSPKCEWTVE